jgi:methylenetetrahydrofolate reductase (NADPH)
MTPSGSRLESSAALPGVAALMRNVSLEATLPATSELDELGSVLPPSTPIYLSAPPGHAPSRLVEAARQVRRAGFEPVPHIAARNYPDRDTLSDFIAGICGEAGVRRVLVIAGDVDRPAGPFAGANDVTESDLLQRNGIDEVGISGYPDGHPKLSEGILDRAMRAKLVSAQERGLKVHIVSQFCFDADRIAAWLRSLRASGILVPVQIGIVGPTSIKGLSRFALRCGVRTSFTAMLTGKATQLLGQAAPDDIIERLGAARDASAWEGVSAHLYSFGGLVRTARWVSGYEGRGSRP